MKNRILSTLIGTLLFLLIPGEGIAQSLFDRIDKITQWEAAFNEAEREVRNHVVRIYNGSPRNGQPFTITASDVDDALSDLVHDFAPCKQNSIDPQTCEQEREEIADLTRRIGTHRALGRDLQIIASSYEVGYTGYTGHQSALSAKLPSIIQFWQSGSDKALNPNPETKIRGVILSEDVRDNLDPLFAELEDALSGLRSGDDEQLLASAVWRYRHGYRNVRFDDEGALIPCAGTIFDGTELELLRLRFCDPVPADLERIMDDIYNLLPTDPLTDFDPPLRPSEIAMFPTEKFRGLNVNLWMRQDDVGLTWEYPIEPILPSLRSLGGGEIILGGSYPAPPPVPEEGEGICSHPFAQRGYLCRPVPSNFCPLEPEDEEGEEGEEGEGDEEEEESGTGTTISLTTCRPQNFIYPVKQTESGPNICEIGGWRAPPDPENPLALDEECSYCIPEISCKDECNDGESVGFTFPRTSTGAIEVCLSDVEESPVPVTYILIHELVHVQQACKNPKIEELSTGDLNCCSLEYPAYFVQCAAAAEDGNFNETDMTVELCAGILSNLSCGTDADATPCAHIEDDGRNTEYLNEINEAFSQNRANVPTTCVEATAPATMDTRALSILHSLPQVCSPKCQARYENTIGNNFCYLGQCIEQSFEHHRMIPGRMPLTVEGQAFPWDSCSAPDPQIGVFQDLPPIKTSRFPPYRGYHMLQEIDQAMCQTNGYPRLTPPVFCAFDFEDQLERPLFTYYETHSSLLSQAERMDIRAREFETITVGVGARLGTRLYTDYLQNAGDNLGTLVQNAATLLQQIAQVEFPRNMCPRYHVNSCSLFEKRESPSVLPGATN